MKQYDYILFDFDGTISDSAYGVRKCIELTLTEIGRSLPDLSDYSQYIGPPLTRTFEKLCGLTKDESFEVLPIYRKYYNEVGICENRLYEGVRELLETLRKNGKRLAVCTSKNQILAVKSLKAIGAHKYFHAICGSKDDGTRKEKRDLIPYALSTLGCEDQEKAVMIGDTYFDAQGARETEVDFIGALYGYGTETAMRKYGAEIFVKTPRELLALLS